MGIGGNRESRDWCGTWSGGKEELRCRYEGSGKVCRNKTGLVMHEKRMHRVNEEKSRLKCERCGRGFEEEGQRVSYVRSCMGGAFGRGREIGGSAGDVRGRLSGQTPLGTLERVGG